MGALPIMSTAALGSNGSSPVKHVEIKQTMLMQRAAKAQSV